MPRFGWRTSVASLSVGFVFLISGASQCGGPAPTSTPGIASTQTATAIPTALPMSTDVPANVSTLQQRMARLVAVVQELRNSAQNITPDRQNALASQMSIFLSQLANFGTDLQPAFSSETGPELDQARTTIAQMEGTVQQMLTATSPGTATPTATAAAPEPTAPGATGTVGPTSTPAAAERFTTLTNDIKTLANQTQPAKVQELVSPLGDLISQMSQLVMALAPTLETLTAEQTYTLDLDAMDLQATAEGMVATMTGATPGATPTS